MWEKALRVLSGFRVSVDGVGRAQVLVMVLDEVSSLLLWNLSRTWGALVGMESGFDFCGFRHLDTCAGISCPSVCRFVFVCCGCRSTLVPSSLLRGNRVLL